MKEYDLYAPLRSEAGKRLSPAKLNALKKELVRKFGGLTYFPQRNTGLWRVGGVTFRDEVVILRVLAENSKAVKSFWQRLKIRLQQEWRQKQILIVAHPVSLV